MGGERYCFLRLRHNAQVDEKVQALYSQVLHDKIEPLLEHGSQTPYKVLDNGYELMQSNPKFCTSFIPLQLADWTELGWQDRHYGRLVDPNKKVVQTIIDWLYSERALQMVLAKYAEDCVHEDLCSDVESSYSKEEDRDLTACHSGCGYCGECDY